MKKTTPALISAFLITAFLAACMLLVGHDALSTSSASAASSAPTISASTISDLRQSLLVYQSSVAQYQQQITAANRQIQQYKTLLANLQNQGPISIAADGSITISQPVSTLTH